MLLRVARAVNWRAAKEDAMRYTAPIGRFLFAAIYSRTELMPDICGESGTAAFAQDESP